MIVHLTKVQLEAEEFSKRSPGIPFFEKLKPGILTRPTRTTTHSVALLIGNAEINRTQLGSKDGIKFFKEFNSTYCDHKTHEKSNTALTT